MIYKCLIEFGHTKKEYDKKYGKDHKSGKLWDFPYEEYFDGTLELSGECVLWFIEGRIYETNEKRKD